MLIPIDALCMGVGIPSAQSLENQNTKAKKSLTAVKHSENLLLVFWNKI